MFVNASRLGEELKKGTFLEKKGGYFKLSAENISTSILSAFHPLDGISPNFKARKRYLFCDLETFLSKEKKGTFFAVTSDFLKSTKKEPLKVNGVFKLFLKVVSNSTY